MTELMKGGKGGGSSPLKRGKRRAQLVGEEDEEPRMRARVTGLDRQAVESETNDDNMGVDDYDYEEEEWEDDEDEG